MHRISERAQIAPLADLEDSVRGSVLTIGDDVVIDSFVKVKFTGGLGNISIGDRSQINSGCVLYSGNGIEIGADCLIAANCTFAPTNHEFGDLSRPMNQQRFRPSKGGIVLGDDVWLGANTVLLDGARVGRGAIVAAHSLVRGDVPEFAIVAGTPARVIGHRGAPASAADSPKSL